MFWFENHHDTYTPFSYKIKKVIAKTEQLQKKLPKKAENLSRKFWILSICTLTQFGNKKKIMSIAALLQAAEYLERRDRGKFCVELNDIILV
jgi:hypothetical protein